jgi:endonuclease/exonuclease/phosphatase family metal-dependent hydrolase
MLLVGVVLASPIKINLIATNDIHGVIGEQEATFMNPMYPPTIVGHAAFSNYIDNLKAEVKSTNEGILIVDGGNFFQGNSLGIYDSGQTIIQWMNRVGYDALVPGRYDFIFGIQNLYELSTSSQFPFLASNLNCDDCFSDNMKPYIIKEINNVNVGVLGIVNSQINELVLSKNLNGAFADFELPTLEKWIPIMKDDGADIIILLSSSGVPWDRDEEYEKFTHKIINNEINPQGTSLSALELGYFADDIDFIVAGGNSKGYWMPWYDPHSHTYVMQGYGNGTEFSHVKLLIDDNSHKFLGFETVIDGRASQTLLSDDFTVNSEDKFWINEKQKLAKAHESSGNSFQQDNVYDSFPFDEWDFPNLGKDENLDIITWNCEFFPHANDSTIEALAEAVHDMDVDIIAFQELRRVGWFGKLMSYLPQYDYIVSTQASFMDLAIIYKNDQFVFKKQMELFADNDYNFAGRPPLLLELGYVNDTNKELAIVNLHMKCCDSGLQRRKNAVKMLHEYMSEYYHQNPDIIVLGDWNDDTKDKPGEHSFDSFMMDSRFYFVTHDITYDISQASYPKEPWVSFLDHILVSENLLPRESSYDVQTIKMGEFMGSYNMYEAYISDHLPVYLSFPVK